MFRKIANILVAAILLTVTTGFAFSMHYCDTGLQKIEVNEVSENCCTPSANCCHTETIIVKIKDYFTGSFFNLNFIHVKHLSETPEQFVKFDTSTDKIKLTTTNLPTKVPKLQPVLSSLQTFLL